MEYDEQTKSEVEGTITKILFSNSRKDYVVAKLNTGEETIVLVSPFYIEVGEYIKGRGKIIFHKKYGKQFEVSSIERKLPLKEIDIEKYFLEFKGVGKLTAQKIAKTFGERAFELLKDNYVGFAKKSKISLNLVKKLNEEFCKKIEWQDITDFLKKYEISTRYVSEIYSFLKGECVEKILKNPYILLEVNEEISFLKAEKIFLKDEDYDGMFLPRIFAGILTVIRESAMDEGHTFLPFLTLIRKSQELLGVSCEIIESVIDLLTRENKIFREGPDGERVYLSEVFNAERKIIERFKEKVDLECVLDRADIDALLNTDAKECHELQRQAVSFSLTEPILVVTGGPGTGKTRLISIIIKIMDSLDKNVCLLAPTGRSARQISKFCSKEAYTIHKFLQMHGENGENGSSERENKELNIDMVIIDEVSMVDILMLGKLVDILGKNTRIVFVGDKEQLPSIGPGNLMEDLSKIATTVTLTKVFRQSWDSYIIDASLKIREGIVPRFNGTDFVFLERNTNCDISNTIVEVYKAYFDKFKSHMNVQIITPTRRGELGTNRLNLAVSELLGDSQQNAVMKKFHVGSKVIQVKNNYDIPWVNFETGVFGTGLLNGDMGIIKEINREGENVTLLSEEREFSGDFSLLDDIDLSYAITAHKSQASEFDVVIIPVCDFARSLMTRRVFYTAVTRAKDKIIFVGKIELVKKFVDNVERNVRYSNFVEKFRANYL